MEIETVGARIKRAREEAGLTQQELGNLIGKSLRQIANYESGTSKAFGQLNRIADATHVTVPWLLGHPGLTSEEANAFHLRMEAIEKTLDEQSKLIAEMRRLIEGNHHSSKAQLA